jgi:hypothetical protein
MREKMNASKAQPAGPEPSLIGRVRKTSPLARGKNARPKK